MLRHDPDGGDSQTRIGQIGRLKLSGKILYRLQTDGRSAPSLLRQGSFSSLSRTTWIGTTKDFTSVPAETNDAWTLIQNAKAVNSLTIAGYINHGKGSLALPNHAAVLENLPSQTLEYNPLGVVRVDEAPPFVNFKIFSGFHGGIDSQPTTADLVVPEREKEVFQRFATELNLKNRTLDEALKTIEAFFQKNFDYTTRIGPEHIDRTGDASPLEVFMTKTRKGHCEYFATAATLLLREAGFPARYAIGYSVQESAGRHRFVVRERHGHAWCLVYKPELKSWEDFDSTPAGWSQQDENQASFFEPIRDFWSRIWFEFNRWRYGKSNLRDYILLALIPIALALAASILLRKKRKQAKNELDSQRDNNPILGLDSEFFEIQKKLSTAGLGRQPYETIREWLERIHPFTPEAVELMKPITQLHYRYRFDPKGLSEQERTLMKALAKQWSIQFDMVHRPDGAVIESE